MHYIYLRDDKEMSLTRQIFTRLKTVETRNRNVFKQIVGERVGVLALVGERKYLVGHVTIGEPCRYTSEAQFDADFERHRIDKTSPWHKAKGVGYPLINVEPCSRKEVLCGYGKGNRSYFTGNVVRV